MQTIVLNAGGAFWVEQDVASGGNFKAGLVGAAAGAAMAYIGGAMPGGSFSQVMEKSAVEGFVGGALTEANGGRFSDGFLGAFAASAAGNEIDNHIMAGNESGGAIAARTAAAAALGGTVSKINGGNFANGAWSAAFQHMFNEEAHREQARAAQTKEYKLALVAEHLNGNSLTGHVFVGGIKPGGATEAYGFYPNSYKPLAELGAVTVGTPGIVRDNNSLFKQALVPGNNRYAVKVFSVDRATYQSAMHYIQNYADKGDYQLIMNNCVNAAFRTFYHVGLIPDANKFYVPHVTTPDQVYEDIERGY